MSIQLAGCVILDENHKIYLLHRNKKGVTQWELPGGKVEPGETPEQAAIRELDEELGVKVRIDKKLGGTTFTESELMFEYTWFVASIESGTLDIKEPESFDDLRSFSIAELADLTLSNNMKKLFESIQSKVITL